MDFIKKMKQNSKLLFLCLLGIAIILMILLAIFVGFTFWFWIVFIIWILFFLRFKIILSFGLSKIIAVFLIMIIVFIILMVSGSKTRRTDNRSGSASTPKLSAEECKPFVEKYNNKVLTITGDNAIGSIGVKIDPVTCKIKAREIITFNANLADNPIPDIAISSYYNYVNNLHSAKQTDRGHYGVGALSQVRRNAMTLPDPYSTSTQISEYYRDPVNTNVEHGTSWYWSYEIDTNFSEARYNELLTDTVFEVVDGLPYMQKETLASGGFSYSIDQERAEKEGAIVKTINLTISE